MNPFPAILQATAPEFTALGIGGTIAGFMFYFYREDRRRAEDRQIELSKEFRRIIADNTAAMTQLSEALHKIAYCPYRSEFPDVKKGLGPQG